MLTLKLISEETDRVIKGLEKKHFKGAREAIEKVLEYDKLRREAQQKLDANKQQQNQLSKQIGSLMKEGKKDEAMVIKDQVADLKAADKALQEIYDKANEDMTHVLLDIPNIPNDKVPEGADASNNVVIKEGGAIPELPEGALCHWDLLKKFNLVELVQTVQSAHILTVRACLAAETGRISTAFDREIFFVKNLVSENIGYGNLGCRYQEKVVEVGMIHVSLLVRKLSGAVT